MKLLTIAIRVHSILFIHGIAGDREKSWRTKESTPTLWPQSLLPVKIPNARVLTFGYDAHVADWRGMVSKNRIGNHAMNLLTTLATYREDDDSVRFQQQCISCSGKTNDCRMNDR